MSKNLIIAIFAGILVIGGGVLFFATQNDNDNAGSANTEAKTEQADQTDSATFNPANNQDKDYIATIKTESASGTLELQSEYDKDSKAFRSVIKNSDQDIELIISEDAYYTKVGEQWIKLPSSGETETGFDRDAYELTDEELADFQSRSKYKGEGSCPAGTCDIWEIDNNDDGNKVSIYIDKESNLFNQIVTSTSDGISTITYTYQDVTIEIPADAQEVPSVSQ